MVTLWGCVEASIDSISVEPVHIDGQEGESPGIIAHLTLHPYVLDNRFHAIQHLAVVLPPGSDGGIFPEHLISQEAQLQYYDSVGRWAIKNHRRALQYDVLELWAAKLRKTLGLDKPIEK